MLNSSRRCRVSGSGTIWQTNLEKTGAYTVIITDEGNNDTMDYSLALQSIFPPPKNALHLSSGHVLTEAITPVADSDVILFDGAAGCTTRLTLADLSDYYAYPVQRSTIRIPNSLIRCRSMERDERTVQPL